MFILLYGPNTFLSRQHLKKLIEDFQLKRDKSGINTMTFDAEKSEASPILEALTSSPFLSEKRLAVVEKLSKKNDKDFLKILLNLVEKKQIPETTVAIFWEGDLGEKKLPDFFNFLKAQPYSKFFGQLSAAQLTAWVKKQTAEGKVEIEKTALNFLVNHPLTQDLWRLASELDKMIAYASSQKDKNISLKIVNLFLPDVIDGNSFHFLDALLAKNAKQALKLLHDQWLDSNAEAAVFGALVWQFRVLLLIKDCLSLQPGLTSDMVAKALKLSPFVVKKALAVLRGFDFNKLKSIHWELLEIDRKVKNGESDYQTLLDLLVVKICS